MSESCSISCISTYMRYIGKIKYRMLIIKAESWAMLEVGEVGL